MGSDSAIYYDPYDFEIDADPYPTWKQMREEAPLYFKRQYDFYASGDSETREGPGPTGPADDRLSHSGAAVLSGGGQHTGPRHGLGFLMSRFDAMVIGASQAVVWRQ